MKPRTKNLITNSVLRKKVVQIVSSLVTLYLIYLAQSALVRPPLTALQRQIDDLAFYGREASADQNLVATDDVVILDLDDESIDRLGSVVTWSRLYDAQLINILAEANAAAIGIDFIYAEPDTYSDLHAEQLRQHNHSNVDQILDDLRGDDHLVQAVESANNIYLAVTAPRNHTRFSEDQARRYLRLIDGSPRLGEFPSVATIMLPIEPLASIVQGIGSLLIPTSSDRIVRYYPTLLEVQWSTVDQPLWIANFPLYMAIDALGISTNQIRIRGPNLELGDVHKIPLLKDGTFRINWLGDQESIRRVSLHKVLDGTVPPSFFSGKYIFIGASAAGLEDLKSVPSRGDPIPGVEVHANAFLNIMNQNFISELDASAEFLFLLLVAAGFILMFTLLPAGWGMWVGLALILGSVLLYLTWIFPTYTLLLPMTKVVLLGLISYALNLEGLRSLLSEQYRQAQGILKRHLSPAIATHLLTNAGTDDVQKRFACILFLDIRNFTKFCEVRTPEEIIAFQNRIFGFMTQIVDHHGGSINQFLGDGFMATFGAPKPLQNACLSAYQTALDLIKSVDRHVQDKEIPYTRIGIGIHAGEVIAGTIGTEQRSQSSVTGNPVIIAARLEQLNKEFGSTLVISRTVLDFIPEFRQAEFQVNTVSIKGRSEDMEVFYFSPQVKSNR